ncbi:alkaline phosphatase D family protein [Aquabacterium sp.]|uniref:alkaline phosphatase D family protein n=1 Tax=Aquabacterium sp. TaxID=1872578 RepID=UPI0037843023
MKIAFVSCFDALGSPAQPVWQRLQALQPDVLLLLGDSIYMDYWPHLGQGRHWPPQRFADEMYRRYAAQWQVPGFRALLGRVRQVGAVWDDHDYAWNKSHGSGAQDKYWVAPDTRRISRALFMDFRGALAAPELDYPTQPPLAQLLQGPDAGIEARFDLDGVRFILLDGRSYRTEPGGDLHGAAQRSWFEGLVRGAPGVSVAASGSTLARSGESWDNFADYEWLMTARLPRLLLLSGDIHANKPQVHEHAGYTLHEATSSGVARRGLGGASGNFAVVDLQGTQARVQWYDDDSPDPQIDKTWQL